MKYLVSCNTNGKPPQEHLDNRLIMIITICEATKWCTLRTTSSLPYLFSNIQFFLQHTVCNIGKAREKHWLYCLGWLNKWVLRSWKSTCFVLDIIRQEIMTKIGWINSFIYSFIHWVSNNCNSTDTHFKIWRERFYTQVIR